MTSLKVLCLRTSSVLICTKTKYMYKGVLTSIVFLQQKEKKEKKNKRKRKQQKSPRKQPKCSTREEVVI